MKKSLLRDIKRQVKERNAIFLDIQIKFCKGVKYSLFRFRGKLNVNLKLF